jgi:hypothetical protein
MKTLIKQVLEAPFLALKELAHDTVVAIGNLQCVLTIWGEGCTYVIKAIFNFNIPNIPLNPN